MLTSPEETKV